MNRIFSTALMGALMSAPVSAFAASMDHDHGQHQHEQHQQQHQHHQHHQRHHNHDKVQAQTAGHQAIADIQLLNQKGEALNFKTDVIADNIVVMDFVYTSCGTVCPVLSAVFSRVQQQLSRQGVDKQVSMVSLTVDPVRDTPQKLQDYARKMHAGDNWTWLTGEKPNVDKVLKDFGTYTPNFEDHPAIVIVGDAKLGTWQRFFGFPAPEQILQAVKKLQAARAQLVRLDGSKH